MSAAPRPRPGELLRAAAALLTLVALVAGLPLLLYRLAGSPVPSHLPGWHQVGHALLSRDSGELFLGAVRDVSWLAWAGFTAAVLAELQAAVRGRPAPRLRLAGLQPLAARLVTLALLTASAPVAAVAAMQPPPAAATTVAAAVAGAPPSSASPVAGPAAMPSGQVTSMGFYQLITVHPGDCLWTIARHYLGVGDRYAEIVRLNIGHAMGDGQVFTDPSVILPGWVLQVPGGARPGEATLPPRVRHGGGASHAAHPSGEPRFRRPHPAAASPAPPPLAGRRGDPVSRPGAPARPAGLASPGGAAGTTGAAGPAGPGATAAAGHASEATRRGPEAQLVVFAAGMLAGGVLSALGSMRHRQRQARRPGRRIPLPASAPVIEAERRMAASQPAQPASALRAALSELGARLAAAGQQIPEIAALRVLPTGLELLLASPAPAPPPEPFTVPGGRQGTAWHLALPEDAPPADTDPGPAGDLLPGLLTLGVDQDGYVLVDLEHLRVTTVDGPGELTGPLLAAAAAELATTELAGWYDLILVGYDELHATGTRVTCCASLDQALDLLAAKAVALHRSLADAIPADVRMLRLTDPGNEDWALAVLVSRIPATPGQLSLLLDLAAEPGGIAALLPGGATPPGHLRPASIEVSTAGDADGTLLARIDQLHLDAWRQPLTEADYLALASLFELAADEADVSADEPPYDGSLWLPADRDARLADGPASDTADHDEPADDAPGDDGYASEGDPADGSYPAGDDWPADDGHSAEGDLPGTGLPGAGRPPGEPAEQSDPALDPPGGTGPAGGQAPDAGPALRIGVLGTFTVNGRPAALQPSQSQLILSLALGGHEGLSNQQLCYLLGADPDHPKPADSLRQLIVRTRRQLGRAPDRREWIEHLGAGQYALHPQTRFDWHEFDALAAEGIGQRDAARLRQALRLIRGQPFAGCYHWSIDVALIETVRAQITDAAEALSALELAAGDRAAAARAARAGLAADSSAEQLWRALMRAEHVAGNLAGVREAWRRCLDQIAEIAPGAEPHPQTAVLYRKLTERADQLSAPLG